MIGQIRVKVKPYIVKRNGLWEGYDTKKAAMQGDWPVIRSKYLQHVLRELKYLCK